MGQCKFCGTRTGQHSFSFGPDGKYTSAPKDISWNEFQTIRVNSLKELLKGIQIVEGHFVRSSS